MIIRKILLIILVFFTLPALAADGPAFPYEKPISIKAPLSPRYYSNRYIEPEKGLIERELQVAVVRNIRYYIHVPANASADKTSTLLLLHGAQRTGASMIDKWKKIAEAENILLIAPTARNGSWSTGDSVFLARLVQAVQKEFGLDPRKTYLFGHSAGANMALVTAASQSDKFAAVSLHAGAVANEWLVREIKNMREGLPITFITGTNDRLFPLEAVRTSAKTFHNGGALVRQYEIVTHNHWYYTIADYINQLAWGEMKKYTLP
jgi:poly(3-hydroxybutyrate) depolymerase